MIDRSFAEALNTFNYSDQDLYELTAAEFATKIAADFDTVSFVDSPLENLALLKDLLDDGNTTLSSQITPASTLDLAAILLGSASDKNVPISTDTVIAITTIMGVDLDALGISASTLAAMADDVREGIVIGHD
ncbi:MAG: hypothetical protein Tsb0019_20440 [Roseibium sp.]